MICREKLQKEHPELVNDCYMGGCAGCPSTHGYLPVPYYCNNSESSDEVKEEQCRACWDREIPEEPGQSVVELLYSDLTENFHRLTEEILGKDYYNMGMDVYTTNKNTCNDILKAYNKLKEERDKCRRAFDFAVLAMLSLAFVMFFFIL